MSTVLLSSNSLASPVLASTTEIKKNAASGQSWRQLEFRKMQTCDIKTTPELQQKIDTMSLSRSSFNRVNIYRTLTYAIHLDTIDMICTVMHLKNQKTGDKAIFGIIYSEILNKDHLIFKGDFHTTGSDIFHRYICHGNCYLSRDGEYRKNFINFNSFNIIKGLYSDIWTELEGYILQNFYKRHWHIEMEGFYPTTKHKAYEKKIDKSIKLNRIHINIFIMDWFCSVLETRAKFEDIHENEKYKHIMLEFITEDTIFFNKLVEFYGDSRLNSMYKICCTYHKSRRYNTGDNTSRTTGISPQIGQKLIPLNLSEVQSPFNIRFKPWREYLVMTTVTDLVLNNICASFPVITIWCYIRNTMKGLFDNPIQYDKIAKSDTAKEIANILLEAQQYSLYTTEDLIKSTIEGKSWLINKFKNLYTKIQEPIDYTKNEIIMSDTVLCILNEHVGRTFINHVRLCKFSKVVDKIYGYPFSKQGSGYFNAWMFELCYSLYTINSKLGIIHGDLHLNNITIFNSGVGVGVDSSRTGASASASASASATSGSNIMYIIDDEPTHQFLLPASDHRMCIIDFSRSMIHPDKIQLFSLPFLPKTHNICDNVEIFQQHQIERLVNIYVNIIPDFADKRNELLLLFMNNFNACFKLSTVLDIYSATQKIMLLFKTKYAPTLHTDQQTLLHQINSISAIFLTTEMNKMLNDNNYSATVNSMELPMLTIITKVFAEYNINNASHKNRAIADIYSCQNTMKYSLSEYEKFPPYMKYDKKIRSDGKEIENKDHIKKVDNLLKYEASKRKNMKVVDYIAMRQKEKFI